MLNLLKLNFDNTNKFSVSSALLREEARLPAIASSYLYSLFPFVISYGPDMVIQTIGKSLDQVRIINAYVLYILHIFYKLFVMVI